MIKKSNLQIITSYSLILISLFLYHQTNYAQTNNTSSNSKKTLQLGSLFKDHMVLQRDMPILVWGKATVGATIIVDFENQQKQTITDDNGKWSVKLDKQEASFDSKKMIISSSYNNNRVEISDVLIGDVWICSGQSNMQFSVKGSPEVKKLIPMAKNIRNFTVKNTVAFEPQDNCEGTWELKHPNSAVAFSFAYFLEKSANIPIGIILTSWGSSSLEAWMPKSMVTSVPHFKTMMQEFDADEVAKTKIKNILNGPKPWSKNDDIFLRRQSNILYNAMMHPLIPYACKGIVWYQGERNTQSMYGMVKDPWFSRNSGMLKYGDVLKEWIKQYRKDWNHEQLQFLVVMLPGYGKVLKTDKKTKPNHPDAHSWAWMRESQLKILELPQTSVVNTIDLGDYKNIHPKDKLPIGERLALLANKTKAIGPSIKKTILKKNSIIVCYNNVEKLKTTDGKAPTGFWIADDSENWFPAKAKINGKKIILTSNDIKHPLYVRYAFTGKPDVNLVNEANLPAYPFRTDFFKP